MHAAGTKQGALKHVPVQNTYPELSMMVYLREDLETLDGVAKQLLMYSFPPAGR